MSNDFKFAKAAIIVFTHLLVANLPYTSQRQSCVYCNICQPIGSWDWPTLYAPPAFQNTQWNTFVMFGIRAAWNGVNSQHYSYFENLSPIRVS